MGTVAAVRAFMPDRWAQLRTVISVLLDIGRLIDRANALWREYQIPVPPHHV